MAFVIAVHRRLHCIAGKSLDLNGILILAGCFIPVNYWVKIVSDALASEECEARLFFIFWQTVGLEDQFFVKNKLKQVALGFGAINFNSHVIIARHLYNKLSVDAITADILDNVAASPVESVCKAEDATKLAHELLICFSQSRNIVMCCLSPRLTVIP